MDAVSVSILHTISKYSMHCECSICCPTLNIAFNYPYPHQSQKQVIKIQDSHNLVLYFSPNTSSFPWPSKGVESFVLPEHIYSPSLSVLAFLMSNILDFDPSLNFATSEFAGNFSLLCVHVTGLTEVQTNFTVSPLIAI